MDKIKILWVVYDFVQAGGQRYVYEILKGLNKDKFHIDFLKISPLGYDNNWDKEYYYESTLQLSSNIYHWDELINNSKKKLPIIYRILRKLGRKKNIQRVNKARKEKEILILNNLFKKYRYVNFSGSAVYDSVCIQRNMHPPNAIIHLLTFRFQGIDIYKNYNKDLFYQFISCFESPILHFELSEFKNYSHTYFPLCINIKTFDVPKPFNQTSKFVIGVFTRLSPMKPLDPYLYALKILIENGINVELKIYGAGNPLESGLFRQLEYLYLKNNVTFCGHTESIRETLLKEKFNLVWFQAVEQQTGGYAAIEIALGGVPQLLWDFSGKKSKIKNSSTFPTFTDLTKFVEHSKNLLFIEEKNRLLGERQREFVIRKHNIFKNIGILEKIYFNELR